MNLNPEERMALAFAAGILLAVVAVLTGWIGTW